MRAAKYKKICRQSDVFGRVIIEETAQLMPTGSRLKSQLLTVLNQEPICKPDLYKSGVNNYDHFRVNLSVTEVEKITTILISHEAEAVSPSGETTSCASLIGGLVDIWHNYIEGKAN